jgi:hypothetical protein
MRFVPIAGLLLAGLSLTAVTPGQPLRENGVIACVPLAFITYSLGE